MLRRRAAFRRVVIVTSSGECRILTICLGRRSMWLLRVATQVP